ncbi:MAG TPA: hypothetical protein VE954_41375 [Oligoflexus sp.]|uniref:hypothetical protein n=1 Tax=Oligoflexus sp. TaxID=1971216 RepID=UPI002D4F05A3|nr:hypothetical protein [Oligoflexus sp.]HYX39593.1 hypothetical protein [Oligoflexus sp.]
MVRLSLLGLILSTASLAQDHIVNQEGRDVQTLYASVGPRLRFNHRETPGVSDLRILPQDCDRLDNDRFDCTEALRRGLSHVAGYETIVLLRPMIVEGKDEAFPETMSCSLIEIRSLIRRAVWDNKHFEGLGFYADGSFSFTDKSQLLVQKDVFFLNNNEPALVHSFIDVGLCQDAGFTSPSYPFKAYAQFTGPSEDAGLGKPASGLSSESAAWAARF